MLRRQPTRAVRVLSDPLEPCALLESVCCEGCSVGLVTRVSVRIGRPRSLPSPIGRVGCSIRLVAGTIDSMARFLYPIRVAAWAIPSQVCRLFHQHHPSLGALRLSLPSRPVPLLIHRAGVRESKPPLAVGLRDPMVMKQ